MGAATLEGLPENDRIEQEKIAMENETKCAQARVDANDEGEDASERFASVGTYNKVTGRVTAEVNELLQRRQRGWSTRRRRRSVPKHWFRKLHRPGKDGPKEAMREIQKARHQKLSRTEIEKRKARKEGDEKETRR